MNRRSFAVYAGIILLSIFFLGLKTIKGIAGGALLAAGEINFYVAPNGNDNWTGMKSTPQINSQDGPFATLEHARDAIRSLRVRGSIGGPVNVWLRGGLYKLAKPIVFLPQDSGSVTSPVSYAAYNNENAVLSGGQAITPWQKVPGGGRGQSSLTTGHLWSANIPRGWNFTELTVDGHPLERASISYGSALESWPRVSRGEGKSLFTVLPGALSDPTVFKNAELRLITYGRSVLLVSEVAAFDTATHTVHLAASSPYSIQGGDPFSIENSLPGLTHPGEWCVDPEIGRVYLWLMDNSDPNRHNIIAPRLTQAFVFRGNEEQGAFVRFISLRDIGLSCFDRGGSPPGGRDSITTNDAAILLWNVEDCSIEKCKISDVGGAGIRALLHVQRVKLSGNEIDHCGGAGIKLQDYGPGTNHVNRNNLVANNQIHDCGETYWRAAGIEAFLTGDLQIVGNHVFNMPYAGIMAEGMTAQLLRAAKGQGGVARWNEIGNAPLTVDNVKTFIPGNVVIDGNVINDCMQHLNDGGGIYLWGGHHDVVRNNRIYRSQRAYSFGIYLDQEEIDSIIENNLVYECPMTPGGKGAALLLNVNGRNVVRNNIFALSDRLFLFANGFGGERITNNIFLFGNHIIFEQGPSSQGGGGNLMDKNLYWSTAGERPVTQFLSRWRKLGWDTNSIVADPLFADLRRFDFRLRLNSPAMRIGFRPFLPSSTDPKPEK